jgi:hypothetical protein
MNPCREATWIGRFLDGDVSAGVRYFLTKRVILCWRRSPLDDRNQDRREIGFQACCGVDQGDCSNGIQKLLQSMQLELVDIKITRESRVKIKPFHKILVVLNSRKKGC